jgi:hypothetical protein
MVMVGSFEEVAVLFAIGLLGFGTGFIGAGFGVA